MTLLKSNPVKTTRKVNRSAADDGVRLSIGEMARTFAVSLRTLRFYEDRGFLVPRRDGTTRWYSSHDKAQLESIIRLKHLGFTLTEIRDLIADADKHPPSQGLPLRQDQIVAQIAYLERQRKEIDGAIMELRSVKPAVGDRWPEQTDSR